MSGKLDVTLSSKRRLRLHLDDVLDLIRSKVSQQGVTIGSTCLRIDVDHAGRAFDIEWTEDDAPKQAALPGTGKAGVK